MSSTRKKRIFGLESKAEAILSDKREGARNAVVPKAYVHLMKSRLFISIALHSYIFYFPTLSEGRLDKLVCFFIVGKTQILGVP